MESTTLSIRTDLETKRDISAAANRLGLSINSFVLMVAKQAARSPKIELDNSDFPPIKLDATKTELIDMTFDNEGNAILPRDFPVELADAWEI